MICFCAALVCLSCAPAVRKVEIAPYRGDLAAFLEEVSPYKAMRGSFSLTLTMPGGQRLSADAAVETGPDTFEIRFYRLGLPVGELDAHVQEQYPYLEEAIEQALLWWQIRDYAAQKTDSGVIARSGGRQIVFDAETFFPISQSITLRNGPVEIFYADPGAPGSLPPLWYPQTIKVRYDGKELELRTVRVELGRS